MSAAEKYIDEEEITKEEAMKILKIDSWTTMKKRAREHGLTVRREKRYYFLKKEILELKESLRKAF